MINGDNYGPPSIDVLVCGHLLGILNSMTIVLILMIIVMIGLCDNDS